MSCFSCGGEADVRGKCHNDDCIGAEYSFDDPDGWPPLPRFYSDPRVVGWLTPIAAVGLLEIANLNQLYRMWTEWTAAGQSLWGWISVQLALWLWLNFYRVVTPKERFAFWGTSLGIGMNMAVILTVIFFRYYLGEAAR